MIQLLHGLGTQEIYAGTLLSRKVLHMGTKTID